MTTMTRAELQAATAQLLGGHVRDFPLARLQRLITLTQYATDILLNEIEDRGELTFHDGVPIIPYQADYSVSTILTRDDGQCRSPFEKTLFLPVKNVTARKIERTLRRRPEQLSGLVEAPAFPSRPDDSGTAARSVGDGTSGAARSHAQRPLRREHGEDGEHRTFPAASTVARSAQAGGTGGELGSSGFSRRHAAFSRQRSRDLA